MGTRRKINAIFLNIKINRPKLVNMCQYKLATYWQNFLEKYLTWVKILQKVLGGGYFFDSHCRADRDLTDMLKPTHNACRHLGQQKWCFVDCDVWQLENLNTSTLEIALLSDYSDVEPDSDEHYYSDEN